MVMGALLLNPTSASVGVTISATITATMAPTMVAEGGNSSRARTTMVPTTTANVIHASTDMAIGPKPERSPYVSGPPAPRRQPLRRTPK